MPTYAVTGSTGHLGRLAVQSLLDQGIAPTDVVAIARTPSNARDLADKGVEVRTGDYSRPETLPAALTGVRRLLLVSGNEVGARIAQHTAVIEAAAAAGVQRIAYTSILFADTTANPLAPEHKATEEAIAASGVPYVFLRNGWYVENYTASIDDYVASGEIVGTAGDGKIAGATRADYAAAAAAALVAEPQNVAYELGGTPFTFAELAATVSDATGTPVAYRDVTAGTLVEKLRADGLADGTAQFVAGIDEAIARGELDTDSGDLEGLIGRPPTPLSDAVRAAVQ